MASSSQMLEGALVTTEGGEDVLPDPRLNQWLWDFQCPQCRDRPATYRGGITDMKKCCRKQIVKYLDKLYAQDEKEHKNCVKCKSCQEKEARIQARLNANGVNAMDVAAMVRKVANKPEDKICPGFEGFIFFLHATRSLDMEIRDMIADCISDQPQSETMTKGWAPRYMQSAFGGASEAKIKRKSKSKHKGKGKGKAKDQATHNDNDNDQAKDSDKNDHQANDDHHTNDQANDNDQTNDQPKDDHQTNDQPKGKGKKAAKGMGNCVTA